MCKVKNKILDYVTIAFKIEKNSLNNYPFIKKVLFIKDNKTIFISTMGQIITAKFGDYAVRSSIEGKINIVDKKDFKDKFVILQEA